MGKVEQKRDVSAAGVSLACVSATAGQQTDSSVASACIGAKRDHFIVLPRQAQDTNITETLNDCRFSQGGSRVACHECDDQRCEGSRAGGAETPFVRHLSQFERESFAQTGSERLKRKDSGTKRCFLLIKCRERLRTGLYRGSSGRYLSRRRWSCRYRSACRITW